MDLDFVSVHKHAKKELGQYPAILTSHLVNNPYLIIVQVFFMLIPYQFDLFKGVFWFLVQNFAI